LSRHSLHLQQIEIARRDMRAVLEGCEQQRLLGARAVLVPPELIAGLVEQELVVQVRGRVSFAEGLMKLEIPNRGSIRPIGGSSSF
jgi:hypothetical protein